MTSMDDSSRTVGYRLLEDGRLAYLTESGVLFDTGHSDAGTDASIAIAWDSDNGTALKHGLCERVIRWADEARSAYAHAGIPEAANSIAVLSIPSELFRQNPSLVAELNASLVNATGMDGFLEKLGLLTRKKVEPGPG